MVKLLAFLDRHLKCVLCSISLAYVQREIKCKRPKNKSVYDLAYVICNTNKAYYFSIAHCWSFYTVFQDIAIGTTIATVAATDDDHGSDGVIIFSLIDGNSEERFQIDPKSGVIELRKQLDRETTEIYSLIVQATDQGVPSMSSTATVNVTLLDVNDNTPLCSHSSYVIEVAENFTVNGTVVSLQCSDADQGQNSVITYNISSGKTMTING